MGRTADSIMRLCSPVAYLQASRTNGDVLPLNVRWDADGRGWVQAYCNVAFTAKNKARLSMGQYGWTASSVADASNVCAFQNVGFPKATYSTANIGWFQVAGYISDAIITTTTGTVGHAVKLATNTVVTTGAAPSGNDNEFAVFETVGAATTYDLLLFPVVIDGAD